MYFIKFFVSQGRIALAQGKSIHHRAPKGEARDRRLTPAAAGH
jgi:hypothetical protein